MKPLIYKSIYVSIFVLLISSMISCAGGSRGTGILTMRVTGRVLNTDGEIINDLPLSVSTSLTRSEIVTDSNGDFEAEILWRFESPVNFELGASDILSTFSVDQIPEDTVLMETVWEVDESGEIVPTSINFMTELP